MTGTSKGAGFYGQMKKKRAFWQKTHEMCESGHVVQMHGIIDSSKYQQIKKKKKKIRNLTASARNLIMGCGWIFHQENG